MFIYKKSSAELFIFKCFLFILLSLILTSCGSNDIEKKASENKKLKDLPAQKLEAEKQSLMTQIDKYLLVPEKTIKGVPYLRGKIVTVEINSKSIDKLYKDLPDNLRATSPDEVKTIIVLKRSLKYVGNYVGINGEEGGFATTETCELKVVDPSIPAVVGTTIFTSKNPPASARGSQSHIQTVESDTIINYLRQLKREK